jgi:hypothetical protein
MERKYSNLSISLCFLALLNKSKYIRSDNKHPQKHDLYSQSSMCHTECKMFSTENFLAIQP